MPHPARAATLLASPEAVAGAVGRLAEAISASHPRGVLVVATLKGSVLFVADLVRRLSVPAEVDFLAVSPYAPGTGRVRLLKDLDVDVAGRDVVLATDIVDTGLTLGYLRAELGRRGPAALTVATLVDKPARRIVPEPVDHVGIEVPDVYVLGYGLDFAGRYRNVGGLWAADSAALAAEPDCHMLQLY